MWVQVEFELAYNDDAVQHVNHYATGSPTEINDVEGQRTVNEYIAQKWLRHFKEDDTSLENKPRSGKPFIVKEIA